MGDILCKIHNSSTRMIIAVCDEEQYGKKLVEGKRGLNLDTAFFKGELLNEEETTKYIQKGIQEDATFNIVGKKSVNLAKKLGIIQEEGIQTIQGIPFALILL